MKIHTRTTRWIYSTIATAALAGAAGLCQAASPIVYDFTNSLQGWSGNEPAGTAATYSWNATNGSTGGGCMQVVLDGVTTTEMDPVVTLPSPLNEAQYLSVSIHMMVDPNSGVTGGGNYGNLQAVFRDASWSWDSIWYGGVNPPAANSWVTYTFYIPSTYKTGEQHLQFQFAGGGYSGPVTNYIDNVTITPLPNPWLLMPFTDNSAAGGNLDSAVDHPYSNPLTHTTTNFTPAGSYQNTFNNSSSWGDWQQLGVPGGSLDLTRFLNIGFDLYLDGPSGGTQLGGMEFVVFGEGWAANHGIGSITFTTSMIGKWTHFDFPASATGITNCPAIVFQSTPFGDGGGNPVTYHIDNIALWSPVQVPRFASIKPNTFVGGVQLSVDGAGDQWDRNQLCIPSGDNFVNYFWTQQEPATYSMTISNFPSPASAPGFEGHIYIANEDTSTAANETSGSPDWNVSDLVVFRVQNGTSSTYVTNSGVITTNTVPAVISTFEWKTNMPAANPPNVTQFTYPALASANGTWSMNFSSDYAGTIVAPDGTVKNFTLPDFSQDPNYNNNFSPGTSFLNFGVFKNDGANSGINDGDSFVLTQVLVTNNLQGVLFDENFPGPGLTGNYVWRTSSATYVQWLPSGLAYLLQWDLPDTGYSVQSAANISGPWADAGITFTTIDSTGTNRVVGVPAASLPAGNTAFFELINTNTP